MEFLHLLVTKYKIFLCVRGSTRTVPSAASYFFHQLFHGPGGFPCSWPRRTFRIVASPHWPSRRSWLCAQRAPENFGSLLQFRKDWGLSAKRQKHDNKVAVFWKFFFSLSHFLPFLSRLPQQLLPVLTSFEPLAYPSLVLGKCL